jgi:hypothetical protein
VFPFESDPNTNLFDVLLVTLVTTFWIVLIGRFIVTHFIKLFPRIVQNSLVVRVTETLQGFFLPQMVLILVLAITFLLFLCYTWYVPLADHQKDTVGFFS